MLKHVIAGLILLLAVIPATGQVLGRVRRTSGNLTRARITGSAEGIMRDGDVATTGTLSVDQIFRRDLAYQSATVPVRAIVLVGADAVTDGAASIVESAIQSLCGVTF